jgi:hypothetical protein
MDPEDRASNFDTTRHDNSTRTRCEITGFGFTLNGFGS